MLRSQLGMQQVLPNSPSTLTTYLHFKTAHPLVGQLAVQGRQRLHQHFDHGVPAQHSGFDVSGEGSVLMRVVMSLVVVLMTLVAVLDGEQDVVISQEVVFQDVTKEGLVRV